MTALIWLVVEAVVAVALLVGIVWWTWPKRQDADDEPADRSDDKRR